jgi:biopolymer transport protein ExbB/TolQ
MAQKTRLNRQDELKAILQNPLATPEMVDEARRELAARGANVDSGEPTMFDELVERMKSLPPATEEEQRARAQRDRERDERDAKMEHAENLNVLRLIGTTSPEQAEEMRSFLNSLRSDDLAETGNFAE